MGMGKIGEIFNKSNRTDYVTVILKDGNEVIQCIADCFGETELEDETTIPDLRVILNDGTSRILINDDIKSVK